MITQGNRQTALSIPRTLAAMGIIGGTMGILVVGLAVVAYVPDHPEFAPWTTYVSDIGDTAGWPQIVFNSGTLLSTPIRFLVLGLLVLRLSQLGAGRWFGAAVLAIGALGALGTILMTAVPFSVGPTIHKIGIPLYFFGVVPLQALIGIKEWRLKLPRLLPVISLLFAAAYGIFFTLVMLYEVGAVGRTAPVIWQWLGFGLSIVWVFAHGLILGREDPTWSSKSALAIPVASS